MSGVRGRGAECGKDGGEEDSGEKLLMDLL